MIIFYRFLDFMQKWLIHVGTVKIHCKNRKNYIFRNTCPQTLLWQYYRLTADHSTHVRQDIWILIFYLSKPESGIGGSVLVSRDRSFIMGSLPNNKSTDFTKILKKTIIVLIIMGKKKNWIFINYDKNFKYVKKCKYITWCII
jgi:hypothetical protein